jgi:hypothetical protein
MSPTESNPTNHDGRRRGNRSNGRPGPEPDLARKGGRERLGRLRIQRPPSVGRREGEETTVPVAVSSPSLPFTGTLQVAEAGFS